MPSIAHQRETPAPYYESDETRAILYLFTARWCGPCHKVQPVVERLCNRYPKVVKLALVDFSSDQELVDSFEIKTIPAFVLLDLKRRLVFRAEDARRETLEALTTAVEKLARTKEETLKPVTPPPSSDPESESTGNLKER